MRAIMVSATRMAASALIVMCVILLIVTRRQMVRPLRGQRWIWNPRLQLLAARKTRSSTCGPENANTANHPRPVERPRPRLRPKPGPRTGVPRSFHSYKSGALTGQARPEGGGRIPALLCVPAHGGSQSLPFYESDALTGQNRSGGGLRIPTFFKGPRARGGPDP